MTDAVEVADNPNESRYEARLKGGWRAWLHTA